MTERASAARSLRRALRARGKTLWARSEPARRVGARIAEAGGFVLRPAVFWAPVWLPLIALVQFALLGLRPARAESRRLDREEAALVQRIEGLHEEHRLLVADRRRLGDPIYRERVRRSLLDAGGRPLTLDGLHRLPAER